MKKLILLIIPLFAFMVYTSSETSAEGRSDKVFKLPETAQELSPSVYFLGHAKRGDRDVAGFAFVHRKDSEVRGQKPGGSGPACYGYLASGAKWKTEESWVVNGLNSSDLTNNFVFSSMTSNVNKWESAAEKADLLGSGSQTNDSLEADTVSPDGVNEVYFASIEDSNTIGVTIVWGYFGGPPRFRELIEWDQIYNDDYPWSESGEANKMDFESISTHELGHTFGMDDIYDSGCSDVTMFGYADFGQVNKRSLETPDVVGVKNLYK